MIILLTILAALGALAGGYVAIRNHNKLSTAMAITSGLILGLVAFDLLPEIFESAQNIDMTFTWPMVLFVTGFLFFHAIEKFAMVHESEEEPYKPHHHPNLGLARAIALAGHSFIDGLSIGVAFQIDATVGYAVALAVIGHRFADGFDTASFMLYHGNKIAEIKKFLSVVVVMPIVGGLFSLVISPSETTLTLYLSFFAGLLMYIAASNIMPQAHIKEKMRLNLGLTIAGSLGMLLLVSLLHS